jgi:hypothetical protein
MANFWLDERGGFDHVVYTGDVRQLHRVFPKFAGSEELVKALKQLPSNGTSNLFCETDRGDISWLYLPDSSVKAIGLFTPELLLKPYNRGSDRHTCVVEFSGNYSYEFMCEEVKKLPGNLKPLSFNYEPNSYIVHNHETAKVSNKPNWCYPIVEFTFLADLLNGNTTTWIRPLRQLCSWLKNCKVSLGALPIYTLNWLKKSTAKLIHSGDSACSFCQFQKHVRQREKDEFQHAPFSLVMN